MRRFTISFQEGVLELEKERSKLEKALGASKIWIDFLEPSLSWILKRKGLP